MDIIIYIFVTIKELCNYKILIFVLNKDYSLKSKDD